MSKVDIGESTSKTQTLLLCATLVAFAWFVFGRSEAEQLPPEPPAWPDAVVLIPPIGIAGSTKIDEWGAENGVEIRRYKAGADLTTAEPWVQELYELSDGEQPCAVVSIGNEVEIIPIEDDLLEELESLK